MLLLALVLMVGCDMTNTPQENPAGGTESSDDTTADSVYGETTASPETTVASLDESEHTESPETNEIPGETTSPEPETNVVIPETAVREPETTVPADTDKEYPGMPNDLEPDFGA